MTQQGQPPSNQQQGQQGQQGQQQQGQQSGVQGAVSSLTQGLGNLLSRLLNEGLYINGDIRIDRLMISTVNKAMSLGLIPLGPEQGRVQPQQLQQQNAQRQLGQGGQQGQQGSQGEQGSQGGQQGSQGGQNSQQSGQGQQGGQGVSLEEFNNLKKQLDEMRQQRQGQSS